MDFFNSKLNKNELVDMLCHIHYVQGVDPLEIVSLRNEWNQLGRAALVRIIEDEKETV